MNIRITSAFAPGPTRLAAFDAALTYAGVHNFNLITLSSVIPPASEIEQLDGPATPGGAWGDRLYVVMAERRESQPGREAWAGVGWVQGEDRKGLFVEHDGATREEVETDIRASLGGLVKTRRETFGPVALRVAGGPCTGEPVCALVVAVFCSVPWPRAGNDTRRSPHEFMSLSGTELAALDGGTALDGRTGRPDPDALMRS